MKMLDGVGISYDDISIVPNRSTVESRSLVDVSVDEYSSPIINAPMYHTSNIAMLKYMLDNNNLTTIHRYYDSAENQLKDAMEVGDSWNKIFFAVGKDTEWIDFLGENGVERFLVDMANGHSKLCVDTVKYINKKYPKALIMAGNVCTREGAYDLYSAGAKYLRVGIASGSICSTEINTGVGVPMVTSLLEISKFFNGDDSIRIIADGGIRTAGDMLKAIACGADYVMCGKLLASTSLARGPFYDNLLLGSSNRKGKKSPKSSNPKYVQYGGMASTEIRSLGSKDMNKSVEGVHGLLKYTGKTEEVIENVILNMKSGMSYSGAINFKDFKEDVRLIKISHASRIEKRTHLEG